MSKLSVVKWPAKVLKTRASEVEVFDKDLQDFAKAMHSTMDAANGVGLAANQVNSLQRVVVIYIPHSKQDGDEEEARPWHNKRFTFVNPKIVEKRGGTFRSYAEGCLSFPGIYDYIDRSKEVVVEAFDEFGKSFRVEADGLFSVCIQHEIDHLDGIVFIERMSRLKANSAMKKLQKETAR